MVVHVAKAVMVEDRPDQVFHALADPTRRDIVRRVLATELSVSALAKHYPMSFAAVQKHVAVLEDAALVTKRRCGRERLVRGDVATVRRAARALADLEDVWRGRIDRMDRVLSDHVTDQHTSQHTSQNIDQTDQEQGEST